MSSRKFPGDSRVRLKQLMGKHRGLEPASHSAISHSETSASVPASHMSRMRNTNPALRIEGFVVHEHLSK